MAINRRQVIIGVVVLGGAVAGYEIYKYEKNKQAAQQAATDSAAAASGYGYGVGDNAQTAYGYGASGATYGYGASGGFPAGYYGYGTPAPPGGGSSTPPVAATTNAQWDQAAITQLQDDGWDAQTVAGALGAYLNGREVNSSQVNIVDAAIGIEGYPPVAGASGYPPAVHTGGTGGGGGGGGQGPGSGGGSSVTVPSVVHDRADTARQELRRAGFGYNISDHAEGTVTRQSPKGGTKARKGSRVTLTLKK